MQVFSEQAQQILFLALQILPLPPNNPTRLHLKRNAQKAKTKVERKITKVIQVVKVEVVASEVTVLLIHQAAKENMMKH